MSYNPNSNYSWTDYRVGLKHDVHNRVSAVCQSHSIIINSSIITSILLHKGCQLYPLIVEYVSWYCFTTMLFRDSVGWSDETTTFRPPKLVLLAIDIPLQMCSYQDFLVCENPKENWTLHPSEHYGLWNKIYGINSGFDI